MCEMANITQGFAAKWDAIAGFGLADGGTSTSSARDNSTNAYIGAWVVIKVSNGSGSDADGWSVSLLVSVDGGTTYNDADTFIIGTGPSPASATIVRAFRIDRLPSNYKISVKNDTGASADFEGSVMEDYFVSA